MRELWLSLVAASLFRRVKFSRMELKRNSTLKNVEVIMIVIIKLVNE